MAPPSNVISAPNRDSPSCSKCPSVRRHPAKPSVKGASGASSHRPAWQTTDSTLPCAMPRKVWHKRQAAEGLLGQFRSAGRRRVPRSELPPDSKARTAWRARFESDRVGQVRRSSEFCMLAVVPRARGRKNQLSQPRSTGLDALEPGAISSIANRPGRANAPPREFSGRKGL